MADDHDHHHPAPPDTSKLFDDRSWWAISHSTARLWFLATMIGAAIYMGAILFWILL